MPAVTGDYRPPLRARFEAMRLMFGLWVVVLIAGVVVFSIVGLSHR